MHFKIQFFSNMICKPLLTKRKVNLLNFYKQYASSSSSSRNIMSLKNRGMFQDIFPDTAVREVIDICNAKPQCVYAGFDPTADSLHIGNLLVLINLLHWQRGGHNVIALLGGATAQIGDPSGRTTERKELSNLFVDTNLLGIKNNIETVFKNHEKYFWSSDLSKLPSVRIINNESWYLKLNPMQLIGKAGRHLRMGTLLSRTSVETRLASPAGMSFTEFSYQLFQAYDWLQLCQEYDCKFQIGGNDQMGNIMSGHELISKALNKKVYGLTLPLVTTEMGDKFGKSAGNAVWLDPKKSSSFTLYQFWLRTTDNDVEKLLHLFTFDSVGSIKDFMMQHKSKPELRLAQKRLAEQVTLLVHGEEGLKSAQLATAALYEKSVEALSYISADDVMNLFQGATCVEILPEPGINVMQLSMKIGCFPTESDAERIITAGGFYINQQRASNPNEIISQSIHCLPNKVSLIRVGKKNYYVVKWL